MVSYDVITNFLGMPQVLPKPEGTKMVSNTKKITFSLYLGYFQKNRAVTAKKLNIFIELRSFQIYMVKSNKISVFREKSDDVITFRSRDPMKHMFSKSPYASVYSCQVWWSQHMPMGFYGGWALCPPVLSNFKKPPKYRVKSSIVLSREIILL